MKRGVALSLVFVLLWPADLAYAKIIQEGQKCNVNTNSAYMSNGKKIGVMSEFNKNRFYSGPLYYCDFASGKWTFWRFNKPYKK
jgi:hypothetical protein